MSIGTRLLVVIVACASGIFTSSAVAKPKNKLKRAPGRQIIGEYIVMLELPDAAAPEEAQALAAEVSASHEIAVQELWTEAVKAFFTRMDEERAVAVSLDPRVRFVEENAEWELSSTMATAVDPAICDPTTTTCPAVVDNRMWHLDRLDQNTATASGTYTYCTDGTGVTVYVVDTGVNKNHHEFGPGGARVLPGYNASLDGMPADDPCMGFAIPPVDNLTENVNFVAEVGRAGHGTAAASLVGGRRVGVAKNVTIVPIKVGRCDRYSARLRRGQTLYRKNETMFAPVGTRYYRALNDGTTATTAPSTWPTDPAVDVADGSVTWQYIPSQSAFSTANLTRGLDWILKPENSGPKSFAVVTLSTYALATEAATVEAAVQRLLDNNLTVIASANNQNGDACDTSPARMSVNNEDSDVAADVITVGGTMLLNRPWSAAVTPDPSEYRYEADGIRTDGSTNGPEPAYQSTAPVREGRWICGAGDSGICWNATPTSTIPPTDQDYISYNAGSNSGPCVTLFAPAKNVPVAGVIASNDYRDPRIRGYADPASGIVRGYASGTSWSAPIVAGVAARILQANPTFTPAQVRAKLLENSVSTLDEATLHSYGGDGVKLTGTPNEVLREGDVNITMEPQSTSAAVSGPTTLSVAAASLTSAAFTYQWYEVNSGFDYATYKSGAFSSLKIAGATGSTYQAPATTSVKAYWVRVSNGCSSADSQIAVVVPRPQGAPSNTVATASGTSVTVTWSMGTGAEKYEVQRKVAGQPWTRAGLVASGTFNFTEVPIASEGMVVYRVLSVAGEAYLPTTSLASSAPSNSDFANVNDAGYEAIVVPPDGNTPVKAQHLIELRQAVNALCDAIEVPPPYVGSELLLSSLQGATVKATDFTGLMAKINAVRTNALLAAGSATFVHTPQTSGVVKREHIDSLRSALR